MRKDNEDKFATMMAEINDSEKRFEQLRESLNKKDQMAVTEILMKICDKLQSVYNLLIEDPESENG